MRFEFLGVALLVMVLLSSGCVSSEDLAAEIGGLKTEMAQKYGSIPKQMKADAEETQKKLGGQENKLDKLSGQYDALNTRIDKKLDSKFNEVRNIVETKMKADLQKIEEEYTKDILKFKGELSGQYKRLADAQKKRFGELDGLSRKLTTKVNELSVLVAKVKADSTTLNKNLIGRMDDIVNRF